MRKITRNKRRTGSAIIQNGYYNGPRHWLLLNPPPLPGREAAFSLANSMVRALAHANGATGNLPEILTHPSLVSSFCQIHTATDFTGSVTSTLSLLLSSSGRCRCKFTTFTALYCSKTRKIQHCAWTIFSFSCKILIIQKIFNILNFKYERMRESLCVLSVCKSDFVVIR